MSSHVDAETLAGFREDLLPRRAAARVAGHLRDCAQCSQLDAQLAGVTAALAQCPAPPMPDTLTERITAALTAETATAARARQAHGVRPGAGRSPARRHRGTAHRLAWPGAANRLARRVAAVAAVAVIVAGAGYGIVKLVPSAQPGTASSGAGSSGAGPARGPGSAAASGILHVVHSGTNYQPRRLAAQVATVLSRSQSSAPLHSAAAGMSPEMLAGRFGNLPACVRHIAGGTSPRLVDVARYRGQPAAVVVVGTRELRVWVVGTGCSGSARDLLARAIVPGTP